MIIWAGQTIGARVQSKPKELRTAPCPALFSCVCVCCGASQIHALGREEKRKNLEKLYYRVGERGYLYIIRVYKWFPLFSFIRRCFCLFFLKEKNWKRRRRKRKEGNNLRSKLLPCVPFVCVSSTTREERKKKEERWRYIYKPSCFSGSRISIDGAPENQRPPTVWDLPFLRRIKRKRKKKERREHLCITHSSGYCRFSTLPRHTISEAFYVISCFVAFFSSPYSSPPMLCLCTFATVALHDPSIIGDSSSSSSRSFGAPLLFLLLLPLRIAFLTLHLPRRRYTHTHKKGNSLDYFDLKWKRIVRERWIAWPTTSSYLGKPSDFWGQARPVFM